jgi:hypothetical protein
MGLGDLLKNIVGKEEKQYKAPDVKFIEDEEPGFVGVTHTVPIEVEPHKHLYIVKHQGEYMIFNSVDEMPEALRETVEHIDEDTEHPHNYHVFINGVRTTYNTLEDIPEKIREMILKNK